jgi:hypothetical protein
MAKTTDVDRMNDYLNESERLDSQSVFLARDVGYKVCDKLQVFSDAPL